MPQLSYICTGIGLVVLLYYSSGGTSSSMSHNSEQSGATAHPSDKYNFEKTKLNDNVFKFKPNPSLSFRAAMSQLAAKDSSPFRESFTEILRNGVEFAAYYFETPPVTKDSIEKTDFEFVLVDARPLRGVDSDTYAFQEHFKPQCAAVTFANLGRDAILVSPCPEKAQKEKIYAHMATFVREGPAQQVDKFLQLVGETMLTRVDQQGNRKVWLSSCGTGVYWLHIRLDSYPKYYSFLPYATL